MKSFFHLQIIGIEKYLLKKKNNNVDLSDFLRSFKIVQFYIVTTS